jgi:chemotaxis protein MotC
MIWRSRMRSTIIAGTMMSATMPALAQGGLQPYQMVRSLQLVQDRIADGDHAALPMQRKLLEMVDARLKASTSEEFEDKRNFQALMIYAMSGGNPATVADSLARLELDESDKTAGAGVLAYLLGDVEQARTAMASIDPLVEQPELAAFLALVKGSVLAGESPADAVALLDQARLLAPGTLVEEAALRRTVALAVGQADVVRFTNASEQYARRFLRSPYATQFAEAFVAGIIDLRQSIDLVKVEQAIAWMTREQARAIYLRLARQAAIDGDTRILDFASGKARELGLAETDGQDARGELYASLNSVTSETVEKTLERLRALDANLLSDRDRALLEAAKAIARDVVAPVPAAAPSFAGAETDFSDDEAVVASPAAAKADAEPADDLTTRMATARSKLDAIDELLSGSEP